jgi:hypothetical protein
MPGLRAWEEPAIYTSGRSWESRSWLANVLEDGHMDDGFTQLREAARSSDFRERALAGERLALRAEDSDAADLLLGLLLDGQDTFVTMKPSEALIARGDVAALRVFARGFFRADPNSADWFENPALLNRAQRRVLSGLCSDKDVEVAAGARQILAWVNAGYGGPLPD